MAIGPPRSVRGRENSTDELVEILRRRGDDCARTCPTCCDLRIAEDRRVLYALKALGGLRHGQAAGLRWRKPDLTLEPLGGLSLEQTKTQVPRRVPVHPTLARVLSEWKSAGFERTYGRAPTAIDLVVPTRNFTERSREVVHARKASELHALCGAPPGVGGRTRRRRFVTCPKCHRVIGQRLAGLAGDWKRER